MQITLVANPNITLNPGKGVSWKKMEVLYKKLDGQVMTKILVSFKNPTVFKVFSEAKQGDVFEVESVKGEPNPDGQSFWEWKSAHVVDSTSEKETVDTAGIPAKPVAKMVVTEADRNRYIVRQSSLERALDYALAQDTATPLTKVSEIAGQIEDWVFRSVSLVNTPEPVGVSILKKPGRPKKVVETTEETNAEVE